MKLKCDICGYPFERDTMCYIGSYSDLLERVNVCPVCMAHVKKTLIWERIVVHDGN